MTVPLSLTPLVHKGDLGCNGCTLLLVSALVSVLLLPVRIVGLMMLAFQAVAGVIYSALVVPIQMFVGLIQSVVGFVTSIPGMIAGAIALPFQMIYGFISSIGQAIAGIPIIGSIFSALTGVQAAPPNLFSNSPKVDLF